MTNKTLSQLASQIIALRNGRQGGVVSVPSMPFVPDEHLLGEYVEIRPSPIPAPLTYKSGGHTGAMIALFLPTGPGTRFLQSDPGALPLNELHVTLAYLGKADNLSFAQVKEAHALMKHISMNHPPLNGHINGCGRFCNGDDDGDPFFIIPDLAALPNLRQAIIDGLKSSGIYTASDHGFVPHITLTYLPHAEHNPFDILEKTPITFGAISLVLGDDRYDYPLAQGVPLDHKALVEKIGARHTGAECALIQKMHDLTLGLGAECHPLTRRSGARHSHADQGLVQRMHDDCRGLGAECKRAAERDAVYGSQVLKEGEIIKGGPTSGNWGHSGRKGKKGGSGSGGGFRRIGVKDGKKAGRKGIKKASRQTRAKDESGKGGIKGDPASGEKATKRLRQAARDIGTIRESGGKLRLSTPYNPDFVDELKAKVSGKDRAWNRKDRQWIVSASERDKVNDIMGNHFNVIDQDKAGAKGVKKAKGRATMAKIRGMQSLITENREALERERDSYQDTVDNSSFNSKRGRNARRGRDLMDFALADAEKPISAIKETIQMRGMNAALRDVGIDNEFN